MIFTVGMKTVSFMIQMFDNSKKLRKIYLSGGELMLVENMYDSLQKFIDNDWAKDIELEYNTVPLNKYTLELLSYGTF